MKNDIESAHVSTRFFFALEQLTAAGRIAGVKEFAKRYGLNARSMYFQRKEPDRRIITPAWLVYLVRDYGVSPEYLLTGDGPILQNTVENVDLRARKVQEIKTQLDNLI